MYEHLTSDIIEVISYDETSDTELNRLYLLKSLMVERTQAEVQKRYEMKISVCHSVRTKSGKHLSLQCDIVLFNEIQNELIGELFLSRVCVEPNEEMKELIVRVKQTSGNTLSFRLIHI